MSPRVLNEWLRILLAWVYDLGGKTFWYTCMWQCFDTAIGWASLCRAPPCVSQSHPYGVYHTPSNPDLHRREGLSACFRKHQRLVGSVETVAPLEDSPGSNLGSLGCTHRVTVGLYAPCTPNLAAGHLPASPGHNLSQSGLQIALKALVERPRPAGFLPAVAVRAPWSNG